MQNIEKLGNFNIFQECEYLQITEEQIFRRLL